MARPLRLEYPGAVWHLTARGGNERKRIFRSAPDYLRFLELLGEAARRYNWIVYAYVLMTNHTHLVIETPEETLSRGMQWLNGKYAQWFNRKYKRSGHLFQGRFKGFVVEKETYLREVLRYVVLNPVRAEMVERPEKYRWSSYRATAGYEPAPAWLAVAPVLALFAPVKEAAQPLYRTFVDDRLSDPRSPFENLVAQLYLGSEGWIERLGADRVAAPARRASGCAAVRRTPEDGEDRGRSCAGLRRERARGSTWPRRRGTSACGLARLLRRDAEACRDSRPDCGSAAAGMSRT